MTVLVSQFMLAVILGVFSGSGMAGASVGLALSVCGQLAKKGALASMAGAAVASALTGAILGYIVGGDFAGAFAGSAAGALTSAFVTFMSNYQKETHN